jgi:hypothetical protein
MMSKGAHRLASTDVQQYRVSSILRSRAETARIELTRKKGNNKQLERGEV